MSRRYRALFVALLLACMSTVATAAPRRDDGPDRTPSLIQIIIKKLHKLVPVRSDDPDVRLSVPKP